MNALTIFIRRPVLATMVTVLLVVLGVFSYRSLGVDLMPKIEFPVVTVLTTLRGASPVEVETGVTKPLEEAINTVSGIDELSSYSYEGLSVVTVRFVVEKSIAEAVQDVRDKVAGVVWALPDGTDTPVVSKIDLDALPILTLSVSGPRDMKEISEISRLNVKEALETVAGVGAVYLSGNWNRAINVILDLDKLEAFGIPVSRVKLALATQNIEVPSGRIDRGASEQVLRVLGRVESMQELAAIVVSTVNGRQVTIGDIGRVEDSVEEPRSMARFWRRGDQDRGASSVSVVVQKQSGTNTIEVIDRVKKRLEELRPTLPSGTKIEIVSDQSRFISRSIGELKFHLMLGGLLASLAVFLFMRNLRSTLIAALAIPTSIVATFTFMRAMNFTLNNMSLLGLTLAVGVVIDDAIVVLENIFRHMEELGKSPFQAAVDGLKEIGLAVLATTTSLIVIFVPVAFMEGMVGRFFFEFGLTVAFAIGVSLVISLTLTPMLSSRFLKHKQRGSSKKNLMWRIIDGTYGAVLGWALRWRSITVLLAIGIVASTVPIISRLGKDFLPTDDRSEYQVNLIFPAGSSLKTVAELSGKIEDELHADKDVLMTLTQIGNTGSGNEDVTRVSIYVSIVDLAGRSYPQSAAIKRTRTILKKFPEVRSGVNEFGGVSGMRTGQSFGYNLSGPDLDALMRYSGEAARKLRDIRGFVDVDTSLASRQPEVRVKVDRQRAADLGISVSDVALSLKSLVGGERVTKYRENVEQYDVWLRLDRESRDDAEIVSRLPIASQKAGLVPLAQVAHLEEGKGPAEIDRLNRQRLVSISANLDGLDLGSATDIVAKVIDDLKLPPAYKATMSGRSKMMGEAMTNMMLAFLLAFVFMYIVLAAQFESFVHPITILLSLPLTLPFAFASLLLLHETMNLYSILGVFMLFGIVKKNGILQIDYTNTLRKQGRALKEAIVEANHARLRPILMTTLTLIAGMTPIALGQGPGAASRAALAKVIIGGQALSLFITLLIVPVAYSLFEGGKARIQRWRKRGEVASEGV